ncbi:MAG: CotH kinase family protein [Clostridia bacterium]|nr:CotH kinase family protein [Clostridia bacterium]
MHKRRSVIATGAAALLLALCLLPLSHLLSMPQDDPDAEKGRMIVEALNQYREYEHARRSIAVQPPMPIEEAWAIEDTRHEAETPLVERMRSGNSVLGYDREERTFYCTLGMNCGDDWPVIELFAEGAAQESVQVAWIDDYAYDYPEDALRDEYRYELLAYTDTQYEYIGLIFTGMPIVSLHIGYDGELGESYVPARVSVSSAEHEAVESAALTHIRGGGVYKGIDKFSYRVELHDEQAKGQGKAKADSMLGMQPSTDWLLLSNAQEETAVRNHLCYDLWNRWNAEKGAPMMLESRLAELFVDDEYMGIYQVMPSVDVEGEIVRMGGSLKTDSAVRMVIETNRHERPNMSYAADSGFFVECRYSPYADPMRVFNDFEDYARLSMSTENRLGDAEFAELAQRCLDVDAMISYYLFMQACGLGDNVFNNLYIWNIREGDRFVYRVSPWDMDLSLQETGYLEDGSVIPYYEERMVLPTRLLDLDVAGAREKLWKTWKQKRETVLMDSELEKWIIDVQEYVNGSGAYRREANKWRGGAYELNLSQILTFEIEHMWTVETTLNERWPLEGQQ